LPDDAFLNRQFPAKYKNLKDVFLTENNSANCDGGKKPSQIRHQPNRQHMPCATDANGTKVQS